MHEYIEIDDASFCTIMELCEGPDLQTYLKKYTTLPEKEAKLIVFQILSGLKYLSEQKEKVIHYDLKPQNILFHKGTIKISDFGLCKRVTENQAQIELTSMGVGTYWYLPPECFEINKAIMINSKVDVWSTGVILYELLYGVKPFGQDMTQDRIFRDQIIKNAKNVVFPDEPVISDSCKVVLINRNS